MTYLENIDVYYSTQVYFARNIIPWLPNDDKVWAQEYRRWLAEQGAWIVPAKSPRIIRNALDFAPGFDNIAFENPADLTMFMLRWS